MLHSERPGWMPHAMGEPMPHIAPVNQVNATVQLHTIRLTHAAQDIAEEGTVRELWWCVLFLNEDWTLSQLCCL